MAVEFYRIKNNALPDNLAELTTKYLTSSGLNDIKGVSKYLKDFEVDKQGYPLDPFGNRYVYKDGGVRSTTSGYETW